MYDTKIRGWIILAVTLIACLLIPLTVFGEAEDCAQEELYQRFSAPINYGITAEECTDPETTYSLEGAEPMEAEEGRFRFALPQGADTVVFTGENLMIKGNDEEGQEAGIGQFQMTISRAEEDDLSHIIVEISKTPLPEVQLCGYGGVILEYTWGQVKEGRVVPAAAPVRQTCYPDAEEASPASLPGEEIAGTDFVPTAELPSNGESEEASSKEEKAHTATIILSETGKKKSEETVKRKKEKVTKAQDDARDAKAETTTESRAESNSTAGESKKSEKGSAAGATPVRRTLVTNIDKAMNHVRISERVTSGKTRINKKSIRVMHNGTDVTDNCIIKMEKDGFTVDTQMNTNEGDSFVTTYDATPEDGREVNSTTTALAEEPVEAEPVEEPEEPVVQPESRGVRSFPKGLAVLAGLMIVAVTASSLTLLRDKKWNLGGNLCRISNLIVGKTNG